jgi:hypothetical protein
VVAGNFYAPASYFQDLLDTMYSDLASLDVTDHQWSDSDGYTRALYLGTSQGGNTHLECWIDLGAMVAIERSMVEQEAALVITYRYNADNDGLSQARMHASLRQLVEMLLRWHHPPSGARCTGVRRTSPPEVIGEGWLRVTIDFNLSIPRGR